MRHKASCLIKAGGIGVLRSLRTIIVILLYIPLFLMGDYAVQFSTHRLFFVDSSQLTHFLKPKMTIEQVARELGYSKVYLLGKTFVGVNRGEYIIQLISPATVGGRKIVLTFDNHYQLTKCTSFFD